MKQSKKEIKLQEMKRTIKKHFIIIGAIYNVITEKNIEDKHWVSTGHTYKTPQKDFLDKILSRIDIDYYNYKEIQYFYSVAMDFKPIISTKFGGFIYRLIDLVLYDNSITSEVKNFIDKEFYRIISSIINDTFLDLAKLKSILEEFMNKIYFFDNLNYLQQVSQLMQKQ